MALTTHQKTFLIQIFKISHPWCACNLVERVKYIDKHFISCVMKPLETICDQMWITIKVQHGFNNVLLYYNCAHVLFSNTHMFQNFHSLLDLHFIHIHQYCVNYFFGMHPTFSIWSKYHVICCHSSHEEHTQKIMEVYLSWNKM